MGAFLAANFNSLTGGTPGVLAGQVIQGLNITVAQLLQVAEIVLGSNIAILGSYSVSNLNDLGSAINEGTASLHCPNGTNGAV